MANFEVEGRSYNTEEFSDHQKNLLHSLSTTKGLISEITIKKDLFTVVKEDLAAALKKEFGSKIKDISDNIQSPQLTLANRKKIKFSEISDDVALRVRNLGFLNSQILYYINQLQVLDSARIEYSKYFYQTIKGTE